MNHQSNPTVFIIASLSADGFIAPWLDESSAKSTPPSTQWTSREDTNWFTQKTTEAGIVIMGRTTWESIPDRYKPLKNRLNIIYTNSPQSIPNSIDISSINNLKPETLNLKPITASLSPHQLIDKLQAHPSPLTPHPSSIAISGGTSIYTQFIAAGVVDKLYLTVEPILFGKGTPLFDKELDIKLHLDQIIDLSDQTKVLEYSVTRHPGES